MHTKSSPPRPLPPLSLASGRFVKSGKPAERAAALCPVRQPLGRCAQDLLLDRCGRRVLDNCANPVRPSQVAVYFRSSTVPRATHNRSRQRRRVFCYAPVKRNLHLLQSSGSPFPPKMLAHLLSPQPRTRTLAIRRRCTSTPILAAEPLPRENLTTIFHCDSI